MLAGKKSAGVTPEDNLRTPLHAEGEVHKQALKPRADITRCPKTWASLAPQKGLMS